MNLSYATQDVVTIVGTKSGTTRTSWNLTSAYQTEGLTKPTKIFAVGGFTKMNLDVLYTMGAGESTNSIELRVSGSPDGTNFYRIPNESVSAGTSTLAAREFTFVGTNEAAATISIGLDVFYKYVEVAFKETGVSTTVGTVYCEATLSGF